MSEFIRCDSCKGKKVIVGMGTIERKCHPCLGVGYVKAETPDIKPESEMAYKIMLDEVVAEDKPKIRKKRIK